MSEDAKRDKSHHEDSSLIFVVTPSRHAFARSRAFETLEAHDPRMSLSLSRAPIATIATRRAPSTHRNPIGRRHRGRGRMTTSAATGSVSETFASVLEEKKRAFIPFICAGDPNLDATKKALKVLDDAGADIIELGVPTATRWRMDR